MKIYNKCQRIITTTDAEFRSGIYLSESEASCVPNFFFKTRRLQLNKTRCTNGTSKTETWVLLKRKETNYNMPFLALLNV